jgi:hypothetical protein
MPVTAVSVRRLRDQNTYHGLPGLAGKGGGNATSAGNEAQKRGSRIEQCRQRSRRVRCFHFIGHNFVGRSDGGTGFTDGVNGDQAGTIASPKDPLLGPLQNNGGPTETRRR